VNGTVRLSYDEGESWPVSRTVYPGSFAYSCLTVLPDGTVGLLYERDDYGKITFARFDLAWLTNGQDSG
jgi:sialidase-1